MLKLKERVNNIKAPFIIRKWIYSVCMHVETFFRQFTFGVDWKRARKRERVNERDGAQNEYIYECTYSSVDGKTASYKHTRTHTNKQTHINIKHRPSIINGWNNKIVKVFNKGYWTFKYNAKQFAGLNGLVVRWALRCARFNFEFTGEIIKSNKMKCVGCFGCVRKLPECGKKDEIKCLNRCGERVREKEEIERSQCNLMRFYIFFNSLFDCNHRICTIYSCFCFRLFCIHFSKRWISSVGISFGFLLCG